MGDRYVAHAAASVLSVCGLWVAQGEVPIPVGEHDGTESQLLVARSFSRTLMVDRIAERAVRGALHDGAPDDLVVLRDGLQVATAQDATVATWSESIVDAWISDPLREHPFRFADPKPPPPPRPEWSGLMGTLRMILKFLRRDLPREVEKSVENNVARAKDRLAHKADRVIFGEDARYRLTLSRDRFHEIEVGDDHGLGSMPTLRDTFVTWFEGYSDVQGPGDCEQDWSDFRSIAFGLLDSGQLPGVAAGAAPSRRPLARTPDVVMGPDIGPHLLNEELRSTLMPPDELLRPGDAAGLADVVDLVAAYLRFLMIGMPQAGEAATSGRAATSGGIKGKLAPLLVICGLLTAGAGVWAWFGWEATESQRAPAAAGAAIASLVLFGLARWAHSRAAAPAVASAAELRLEAARALPAGTELPDDPEERDRLIKLTTQQLDRLRTVQSQLGSSFVGQVSKRILSEIDLAQQRSTSFFKAMSDGGPAAPGDDPSKHRRRGVLRRIWRPVAALVVAVVGIMALVLLPLAGAVLVALVTVYVIGCLISLTAWAARWIRRRWERSVRLPKGESERSFASRAIYLSVAELVRLYHVYEIFVEWSGGLRAFVAQPLGGPFESEPAAGAVSLQELHSHQVAIGAVGEPRIRRLTAGLRQQKFVPGWLRAAFDDLLDASMDRFADQKSIVRERANPDADDSPPDMTDTARTALLQDAQNAARRSEVRVKWAGEGFRWLAEQPPDELIDGLVNLRAPAATDASAGVRFLAEAYEQNEVPFIRTNLAGFHREQVAVTTAARIGPQSIVAAGLAEHEGVAVRVARREEQRLMLQTVAIEFGSIDRERSALLSADAAREVDPTRFRPSAERRNTPVPRVSDDVMDSLRQRVIEPIDTFPVGTFVNPSGAIIPPSPDGPYDFMIQVDGQPHRFDLGEPIPFKVRETGGPADGLKLVRECLQRIADATGFRFKYAGMDDRFPGFDQHLRGLWIGWIFPEEDDSGRMVEGKVIGLGGPRSTGAVLSGGVATVRAFLDYDEGFGPQGVGNVLLHELGHAMNLGHVQDARQIMFPFSGPDISGFGGGDLYGLWVLGSGRHAS